MTRTETSVNSRYKKSIHFAHHLQFFFHLAENRVYAKRLSSIYCSHICNVNYLIKKIEAASATGPTNPIEIETIDKSETGDVKACSDETKEVHAGTETTALNGTQS